MKNFLRQHKNKSFLLALALVQTIVSFLTNVIVVRGVGFNNKLDVFYIAFACANFLITSIGWALSGVLTPFFVEKEEEESVVGEVFLGALIIALPITILALITLPLWYKVVFTNYLASCSVSLIFGVQGVLLMCFLVEMLNIVLLSSLRQKDRYISINCINLLAAIVGLITTFICIQWLGILVAAINQLVIRLVVLLVSSSLVKNQLWAHIRFNKRTISLLWERMKYLMVGSIYYRTEEIFERFVSSFLSSGFLSLTAFIQRVYGAAINVLNGSIIGPTITKFSYQAKQKNYKGMKKTFHQYLAFTAVINILMFLGVIFPGIMLFKYFFGSKVPVEVQPYITPALILLFTMVGGKMVLNLMQALLMSLKQEKSATKYDMITFTFNLACKVLFTYMWGYWGLLVSIMSGLVVSAGAKFWLVITTLNKLIISNGA